jgi:glucose/arabinose dehydrogenase
LSRIIVIMLIVANLLLTTSLQAAHSKPQITIVNSTNPSATTTSVRDNVTSTEEKKINSLSNPEFILIDNQSGTTADGLVSYWTDSLKQCGHIFICTENFTTGWKDNTSLQISTNISDNKTWSYISGKEIDVKPNEQYKVVTHMKLNEFARQSHLLVEGFNESSDKWQEIMPSCPGFTDGPLEWREFSCEITIPQSITQIRPILYAGFSSQKDKDAVTLFDSIYMIKLTGPVITDPKLKTEVVYKKLNRPVSMAFLGPDDILVLENRKGTVVRIINGEKLARPLLDVNVAEHDGLLGIAIAKNVSVNGSGIATYVFLYYTEARNEDREDDNHTIGNRLYRYELAENGSKLVNPKLLLDLPAARMHNGGPVLIGPDNLLYVSVGELESVGEKAPTNRNKAINYKNGVEPDGRAGILRMTMEGRAAGRILGDTGPLSLYYGYGIRNSFGMDFDPLTKKLWLTDNGPNFGDEINLVEPGFNGGWAYISGMMRMANESNYEGYPLPTSLVDFDRKGKYSPPKFTWNHTVGPTALKFLTSNEYGKDYENDMFIGEGNNGRIYHFDLNQNRTELYFQGSLADKVANSDKELDDVIFAKGFRPFDVTDLVVGPDGYLYVVAMVQGKIFKIVPRTMR